MESAPQQDQAADLEPDPVDRSKWPTLGCKTHPDNVRMVDVAAALVGKARAHLVEDSTLAASRQILADHGVAWPPSSEAA